MDNAHTRFSLLGMPIDPLTCDQVLEKIKLYLSSPRSFHHIVSINPENIVIAQDNHDYRALCQTSDLALTDGIGVVLAAKIVGKSIPERVAGSKLLPLLLDLAGAMSSTVVLIGGQANLADKIAKCYSQSYPEAKFIGIEGYKNKISPTTQEESHIESIVRTTRPHFVIIAFGSPFQELWIDSHKSLFKDSICMGVGGTFSYLSGATQKPPSIISQLGFEWLFRLINEPWRVQRQLTRLPRFVALVLKEWI